MSTPRLWIFGAGGHAKMVIEVARSRGYEIAFCVDALNDSGSVLGVPVVRECHDNLEKLRNSGDASFVALGSNSVRRRVAGILESYGIWQPSIVSTAAYVSPSAVIERGVVIMPHAVVGAEAKIGFGAIVNTNASVDHDCCVGEFAHVGPGCSIAGSVVINRRAFLGAGCSVVPEVSIGEDAVVGAGAVVISNIPPCQTWAGVPARRLQSKAPTNRVHAA